MTKREGQTKSKRSRYDTAKGLAIIAITGILIVLVLLLGSDDRHARRGTPGDFGYEHAGGYRPVNSETYARGPDKPYPRVITWATNGVWEADALVEGRSPETLAELLTESHAQGLLHKRVTTTFVHFLQFATNDISNPRQMLDEEREAVVGNFATPPLDGSTIYGKYDRQLERLRSHTHREQLALDDSGGSGESLLPVIGNAMFSTGDVLIGASPGLVSIYTLFARVHNEIALELKRDNPTWKARDLFFTARAITNGFVQSIVYNEVLPLLVGEERYERLLSHKMETYRRHTDVVAFEEVVNAALVVRLLLEPYTTEARDVRTGQLVPELCAPTTQLINQLVTNTSMWKNGTDTFLLGAAMQEARQISLSSELYDLPLQSIKYGREHGLATYQTAYSLATGRLFDGCRRITNTTSVLAALKSVYGENCDFPIDLGVGIIAEDKFPGALCGEVGAYLVELQFGLIRDGDPYFYAWDPVVRPYFERIDRFRFADAMRLATRIDPGVIGSLASPFLA